MGLLLDDKSVIHKPKPMPKGVGDHADSIYIRVKNPTFNRNIGKYNLHHIWDRVLLNTPDLKINSSKRHAHRTCIRGHTQSIPTNKHLGLTGYALNS